jgi:hypothetical protein
MKDLPRGCKYLNCSCNMGTGCIVVRERERDKSNDK